MKVTILVPIYNEEKTIAAVVEKLKLLNIQNKEIILIDDGSKDRTREILPKLTDSNTKIFLHSVNQGKGKAIQTGIEQSTGDIIAIQDADLEYDPEELAKLVEVFNTRPDIDAVFGSRFLKKNPNLYKRFLLGNKIITLITNLLYRTKYTDTYTCYKIIKKDVMKKLALESKRFEMEAEICAKLARNNCKVIEIPINYSPRTIQEGKKIGLQDAIKGVITLLKYMV